MESHWEHRRRSNPFWAYVLIIFGILWIMSKSGWDIHLPGFGALFSAIGNFFGHLTHWSAGVNIPIILLILGILLIAGRRVFGTLLLVLLIMILIPNFLIIPGILMILFFPLILILIGIVVLTKLF